MRRVSLILPTYEETELTASLVRLAEAAGPLYPGRPEILVVDDSSPALRARFSEWADAWNRDPSHAEVRVLEGPHRGKGAAVRVGALASRGDSVFVMDADLPIPLERLAEFVARLDDGADVVIGERPMTRNAGEPLRFVLSRGLALFQRVLIFPGNPFNDTQCGFKAFRGDVLRRIAREQVVDGGMYDVEYLYMARHAGLRIDCIPVVPNPETRPSKINVKRAMFQDPQDLLRVRFRGVTGRYRI